MKEIMTYEIMSESEKEMLQKFNAISIYHLSDLIQFLVMSNDYIYYWQCNNHFISYLQLPRYIYFLYNFIYSCVLIMP